MSSAITWISLAQWLTCLLTGVVLWTSVEYGIHRWLYHSVPLFIPLHDAHHSELNVYIGATPFVGIVLIFIVICFPVGALSTNLASGLTTGTLLGYMGYQLVHHRARLHQFGHHHHHLIGNFGITTTFWDQVFGAVIERTPNPSMEDPRPR